jgi:hypothetical protein
MKMAIARGPSVVEAHSYLRVTSPLRRDDDALTNEEVCPLDGGVIQYSYAKE